MRILILEKTLCVNQFLLNNLPQNNSLGIKIYLFKILRTKFYQNNFCWNVSSSDIKLFLNNLSLTPLFLLSKAGMKAIWKAATHFFMDAIIVTCVSHPFLEKLYVVCYDWFIVAFVLDLSLFIIFFVKQTNTFVHIITQCCLSISKVADGSQHLNVETCNDNTSQKWLLRNYTRAEIIRNIFGNFTDDLFL